MRQQWDSAWKQKHTESECTIYKTEETDKGANKGRDRKCARERGLPVERLTLQKLKTIYSLNSRIQFKVSDKMRSHISGVYMNEYELLLNAKSCMLSSFSSVFGFEIAHFYILFDLFTTFSICVFFVRCHLVLSEQKKRDEEWMIKMKTTKIALLVSTRWWWWWSECQCLFLLYIVSWCFV